MTATHTVPGPVDPVHRALAPDLARGAALLLIALANAHLFLTGHVVGVRGYPSDPAPVDHAVALVQLALVDGRAYPLFGALLGYGLVRIADRSGGSGTIRRRSRWLLVLGLLHGALLFSGDVLGAYGALGLLLGGVLARGTDRRLLWSAMVWLPGTALAGAAMAAPGPPDLRAWLPSMTVTDPLAGVAVRAGEWLAVGLLQALGVAAAVLVGAWAGRHRVLEHPDRHRRLLVRTAAVGLPLATLGAVPLAALTFDPDPGLVERLAAGALHAVTGYGGGLGYAALAGLAALSVRGGPVTTALAACGERSLSCYLAQSVVFVAVLASYGGGFGGQVGTAAVAALAVATWAATVLAADLARRAGRRGPAEVWLRRRPYPAVSP